MERPDVLELMRLARENPVVLEAVQYIKELDKVVQAAKEYVHAPHYTRDGAYDELVEAVEHFQEAA